MGGDGSKPLNSSCLHGANVIYLFLAAASSIIKGEKEKETHKNSQDRGFFNTIFVQG